MTGVRSLVTTWPARGLPSLLATHDVVVCCAPAQRPVVREVLGAALRMAPADVVLRSGAHGKPFVVPPFGAPPLWFSSADSGGLLVVAVSRVGEVGVDVERARAVPGWRRIAERVLDGAEQAELAADLGRGRNANNAFLRQWCRVEAALKVAGSGLAGLDERRTGARPAGFRLADLTDLPLPKRLADDGARYHAAVALCAPSPDRVPCRST